VDHLLKHWGLQGYDVRPLTAGTNNTGYYVGDEFVLRIHRNAIPPTYEHAVLRSLGRLSFAVPVPVPAGEETAVRGNLNGHPVLASLSRRIPGEHPVRGNARQAEACGRALGELDHALAALDPAELPQPHVWDGDLTAIHPRVPNVDAVINGVPAAYRTDVARILNGIRPRRDLPQQIIHGDFATTNVLLAGERVTAILDFETAGPGWRAMELELMREATSLVHWYGRYVDGQTTADDLAARVERLLRVESAC
jgi:Ser/Thr protein kinase RdoA (MazF antagonist)